MVIGSDTGFMTDLSVVCLAPEKSMAMCIEPGGVHRTAEQHISCDSVE